MEPTVEMELKIGAAVSKAFADSPRSNRHSLPTHHQRAALSSLLSREQNNMRHHSAITDFKRTLSRHHLWPWRNRNDSVSLVGRSGSNQPPRLIFKNGEFSISAENVPREKLRYLLDIFTTILELKWRYCFLLFSATYMISWCFYAILWYVMAVIHGDTNQENIMNPEYRPCVAFVHNFTTALLYSLETQTTIGYGFRHVTDQCPQAIVLIMFQCLSGVIIEAFMVGYIFTKLARPSRRAQTIIFSETAVVSMRDGVLCLCMRVADMRRRQHLLTSTVRGLLIRTKVTEEGERLPLFQHSVSIGSDEVIDCQMFMFWPIVLVHKIDEESPFYDLSPESLSKENFELVVVLEGTVEATGMTAQVRTSYLPNEIVWGQKFKPLVGFHSDEGIYRIDYSRFAETELDLVPPCSGRELAENPAKWKAWAEETRRAMQLMIIDDPYNITVIPDRSGYPSLTASPVGSRRSSISLSSPQHLHKQIANMVTEPTIESDSGGENDDDSSIASLSRVSIKLQNKQ